MFTPTLPCEHVEPSHPQSHSESGSRQVLRIPAERQEFPPQPGPPPALHVGCLWAGRAAGLFSQWASHNSPALWTSFSVLPISVCFLPLWCFHSTNDTYISFVFSRVLGTKLKSPLKSSPSPFPSPSSRSSQLSVWCERELATLPGKIVQNGVSSWSQQSMYVYLAVWHPLSTDGQSFFTFPWMGTWGLSYSLSPPSPCSSMWPQQWLLSQCPLDGHLGCLQGFATMKHTAPCTRSRASLREVPTFRIWHCPLGMMLLESGLLTWEMRRFRCVCSVC